MPLPPDCCRGGGGGGDGGGGGGDGDGGGGGELNYGDMLHQEGALLRARREGRAAEARLREEEKLAKDCTFKPAVSPLADQFAHRTHIGERSDEIAVEKRERLQRLAETVRADTDRELTFRPSVGSKSRDLTRGYGGFLAEQRAREQSHTQKMQALRASRAEEERRSQTPRTRTQPRTPRSPDGEGGPALPPHERLYSATTAAYSSRISPATDPDPECTFMPNAQGGSAARKTRDELEQVSEALFRDAHNRQIRRQMMQDRHCRG